MEFKYNSIWPKGKGRKNVIEVPLKDGSKVYLKPIVKTSPTDKEKTEEKEVDIPEEPSGWHGSLEHPPLFEPMEEVKTENVEEEESKKEEDDAEEREMGRKKKKKKKINKKKKKKKITKKKKIKKKKTVEEEDEKEQEVKGTAVSEGQDKLMEVNEVCKCVKIAPGLKRKEKEKKEKKRIKK